MKTSRVRNFRKKTAVFDGIFSKNIVLTYGLSITGIVAAAINVRNAIVISMAMFFALAPILIIASIIPKKVPKTLGIAFVSSLSMFFIYLSSFVIKNIDSTAFESLGIYFPLMTVTSAGIIKANQHLHSGKPGFALADGIINSLGYFFAAFIVGTVREIFSNGTFMGISVAITFKIPALKMTFGGFIVLAFLAAGCRAFGREIKRILFKIDNKINKNENAV